MGQKNLELRISIILFVITGIIPTIFLVIWGQYMDLDNADIVANIIQIWIGVGAFISVVFVASSYIKTNQAFLLSQKPHLLLFVSSVKENQSDVHLTIINYHNKSDNPFTDLSISVTVSTSDASVDLIDLFTDQMYMAAHDERCRTFNTRDELSKKDFDIDTAFENDFEVTLSLGYSFTLNKKKEEIHVQKYQWKVINGDFVWNLS